MNSITRFVAPMAALVLLLATPPIPALVTYAPTGEVRTVRYHELIPMLLNELQHEHQARRQESARVASLETQLAALQALVAAWLGHMVAQDGPGDMR